MEPAEGAFDDPAAGQQLESFGVVAPAHDLQAQGAVAKACAHPVGEFVARVAAVGPEELEIAQGFVDLVEQEGGSIAVLQTGGVDAHL